MIRTFRWEIKERLFLANLRVIGLIQLNSRFKNLFTKDSYLLIILKFFYKLLSCASFTNLIILYIFKKGTSINTLFSTLNLTFLRLIYLSSSSWSLIFTILIWHPKHFLYFRPTTRDITNGFVITFKELIPFNIFIEFFKHVRIYRDIIVGWHQLAL